jgi:DNA-directed RNA polymerase specialized sigma subunit
MASKKDIDKVERFIKDAATSPAKVERATQRYEEARGRRTKEIQLWHSWNESGKKQEHLEPLLKSLEPLIRSEATKRMQGLGGSISKPALQNELRNATMRALETYNPNKGTQLTTHVVNNFMRITDFIAANRNPKYMPREDVERFGAFQNAKTEFSEVHGRDPTHHELQTLLPTWKPQQIKKMQRGFGSEAFTDMGTDLEHDVQGEDPMQRVRGALILMKSQLTPEQQAFAEMHYPAEGERQKSVAAIARAMKIPEHKAYRIKKKVEAKLAPIIKGQ